MHASNQIEIFVQVFDFEQKKTNEKQLQAKLGSNTFSTIKRIKKHVIPFCYIEAKISFGNRANLM